ncbi:hypothetical protein Tco_0434778 [Tanacetum coccineum]
MQGTLLTKQERECKLYDEFDKFTYKKGESLHEYYLRFTLLLNDMNIYKMPLEQFQVNTKFLNTLPAEWSKFATDVKLVKDLHTTNVDQIHAHLEPHERHANEHGDDPIDAINHVMSFLSAVVTFRYPTTNNQLKNSTNPRQQATINNGRVTIQPIQGRQISYAAGEGHMSKKCTKPRRKRDDSWFKDKVLLVQAQASGQIIHEEELAFLADPGIPEDSSAQSVEIDRLKQTLSEHLKEKESLMQMVTLLKIDFKKEESRNIDREIALEKHIKWLDNIIFKRDQSTQTVHMLTKP